MEGRVSPHHSLTTVPAQHSSVSCSPGRPHTLLCRLFGGIEPLDLSSLTPSTFYCLAWPHYPHHLPLSARGQALLDTNQQPPNLLNSRIPTLTPGTWIVRNFVINRVKSIKIVVVGGGFTVL